MAHNLADIVRVAGSGDKRDVQPLLNEQVADRVRRPLPLRVGHILQRAPLPLLVPVGADVRERVVGERAAPLRIDVVGDAVADVRVGDAAQQFGGAALVNPRRNEREENRARGGVGILIERHVHARVARVVHKGGHLRAHAGNGAVVVRDLHRNARALADGDRLAEWIEQAVAEPVSRVRDVDAAVGRDGARDRREFPRVAVDVGNVGEAGREAERALAHRIAGERAHSREFHVRRQAGGPAHRLYPKRGVRNEEDDVARRRALKEIEKRRDGRPLGSIGRASVDGGEVVHEVRAVGGRDGGVGEAVLPQRLGGDALADFRLVAGIRQEREVGVRMHIYEAGADGEPCGVNHAPGLDGADVALDERNLVACDSDGDAEPCAPRAVNHLAVDDERIEHRRMIARRRHSHNSPAPSGFPPTRAGRSACKVSGKGAAPAILRTPSQGGAAR